jgi:hypothetical protein
MLRAKSIRREKRRHIFSLLLFEPYEENNVCGKDRSARAADKKENESVEGWAETKRRERSWDDRGGL